MASAPTKVENRMSFAKVAASGGKENISLTSFAKVAAGNSTRDGRRTQTGAAIGRPPVSDTPQSISTTSMAPKAQKLGGSVDSGKESDSKMTGLAQDKDDDANSKLVDAVKALSLHHITPSLVVNGSGPLNAENKLVSDDSSPEDPYQRTDSGSDLGTKPPSLDGKSITSGTTFALDEKESLRPDDSASVKAAAEDDDTFSGRGSIVAGSRIGSEAAARAYRAQTYDLLDRRAILPNSDSQGIITPQSGSSGHQIVDGVGPNPLVGAAGTPDSFNLFYKQTPDEKLIEALRSPKDRIFLLRLEQDVIEFVKDSKEPFMDLPPCNSFCRMLTHKLADYYHMTHQFDSTAGSVRIFRTPFCRLPESLSSISSPSTNGNTPPPTVPMMKIMRRGGDTGSSPSKAASETGSDNKDKALSAKEKLSREEREAAYNKARERIFGNSEKSGDATPDTEDGNDISRSSSVSAKDKSIQNKRGKPGKQRRDDSESFDVRSQYTPFFPNQQQPAWNPLPQYGIVGVAPYGNAMPNAYVGMTPQYPQPPQPYPPPVMPGTGMPTYPQMPQQFTRPGPSPFPPHGSPMAAYAPPISGSPQQPWAQTTYQSPYQPRGPAYPPGTTIPYAYGQLPSTTNPADPKSQHPIPGSYNRHAFNPKTQSFVPGTPGMPMQQPLPHNSSPHPPFSYMGPPQFGSAISYDMTRQGSDTSLPSYHASPHMPPRPMMHQGINPSGPNGSNLPHFGNVASLPPKPPPAM